MLIARLIADPDTLETALDAAGAEFAGHGWKIAEASMLQSCGEVLEILLPDGDAVVARGILDRHFRPSDMLVSDREIVVPALFVSDMDSTMIGQECIDELADFAGIKDRIAAITERAMQGELDFADALTERVALLEGLDESAIERCLSERIRPMPGARILVETLKNRGCHTVLVTGGFHSFADPVAEMLGFERVVGNVLGTHGGRLTGRLASAIVDSSVKEKTLRDESARLGSGIRSLAMGDGANDIPMLQSADYGIAYHAKPKARAASDGWIDRGDLTSVLRLFDIPHDQWVG